MYTELSPVQYTYVHISLLYITTETIECTHNMYHILQKFVGKNLISCLSKILLSYICRKNFCSLANIQVIYHEKYILRGKTFQCT